MFMHAVAILMAGWNKAFHIGAHAAELFVQNCGCTDTVRIVIAVDADAFMAIDRGTNAIHGNCHIGQIIGIVQIGKRRFQERQRFHKRRCAAAAKRTCSHFTQRKRMRKRCRYDGINMLFGFYKAAHARSRSTK